MTKQVKEAAKTFIIVLLFAFSLQLAGEIAVFAEFFSTTPAFLTIREWVSGITKPPASLTPDEVYRLSFKEAARPLCVMITDDMGNRHGIRYDDAALSKVYDKTAGDLGAALGSASAPVEITESEWLSALGTPNIFFDFYIPVPVNAIPLWYNIDIRNYNSHSARMFILSRVTGGVQLYYVSSDGKFYSAGTAASLLLFSRIEDYMPNGAYFAFEGKNEHRALGRLFPYTVILKEPTHKFALISENPLYDTRVTESVLTAFKINPYSNSYFIDYDGAAVYVEASGNLRISQSGLVTYRTPEGAVSPLKINNNSEPPPESELIESARSLIEGCFSGWSNSESLYFTSLSAEMPGIYTVRFNYYLNGAQVVFPDGDAVSITISGGYIIAVKMHLRNYIQDESREIALLPDLQAAAIAAGKIRSNGELRLVYPDTGTERLSPEWIAYPADSGG